MAFSRTFSGIIAFALTAGCQPASSLEDTGFRVVSSVPGDGETQVVESTLPELRVNGAASEQSCTTDSVRLVMVDSNSDTVTAVPDYTLEFLDNGRKIKMVPSEAMTAGFWYMMTVRSGNLGCTNSNLQVIKPFAATFFVPD